MDDFFESIWLIHYLSKVFGQANVKIKGPPQKRHIKGCLGAQSYSLILHTVVTAASIYAQIIQKFNFSSQQKLVTLLQDNTSILLTMFSAIFNIYHVKKQLAVINKLISIDEEIARMGIYVNHGKLRIYIYIIMSIQYGLMFGYYLLEFALIKTFVLEEFLYIMCTLFRKNARVITIIQIQVWSVLLTERFVLLKNNLRQNASENGCPSSLRNKVKNTARLHQELCWATRNMNDIYAVQCLTSSGLTFVTFVMDLYNIFLMFDSGCFDVMQFLLISYSVFNGVVHFCLVLYHCTSVANRANEMRTVLYEIYIPPTDDLLRCLVFGFLIQLQHDHLIMTAFGFFTADFTQIYNMAGAVSSYLLILIQFKKTNDARELQARMITSH